MRPPLLRLVAAAPGFGVLAIVIERSVVDLGLPSPGFRIVLAMAPVAVLVLPVARGAVDGFLPGALLAVALAAIGGTDDVIRFGVIGTALLVIASAATARHGRAALLRGLVGVLVGAVTTGVLVVTAGLDLRPPAASASVAGLGLAALAVLAVGRFEAAASSE